MIIIQDEVDSQLRDILALFGAGFLCFILSAVAIVYLYKHPDSDGALFGAMMAGAGTFVCVLYLTHQARRLAAQLKAVLISRDELFTRDRDQQEEAFKRGREKTDQHQIEQLEHAIRAAVHNDLYSITAFSAIDPAVLEKNERLSWGRLKWFSNRMQSAVAEHAPIQLSEVYIKFKSNANLINITSLVNTPLMEQLIGSYGLEYTGIKRGATTSDTPTLYKYHRGDE